MKKINENNIEITERLTVNTDNLAKLLSCGRATAVKIGEAAKAKIQIGRCVLWNVRKIQKYLDKNSV